MNDKELAIKEDESIIDWANRTRPPFFPEIRPDAKLVGKTLFGNQPPDYIDTNFMWLSIDGTRCHLLDDYISWMLSTVFEFNEGMPDECVEWRLSFDGDESTYIDDKKVYDMWIVPIRIKSYGTESPNIMTIAPNWCAQLDSPKSGSSKTET